MQEPSLSSFPADMITECVYLKSKEGGAKMNVSRRKHLGDNSHKKKMPSKMFVDATPISPVFN